jgi:hypothetical protein
VAQLTTRLDEQASQIQKVSDIAASKPALQVFTIPKSRASKTAAFQQSAVTSPSVAASIQLTPCSTAMNRGDGLLGSHSRQGIKLFH